MGVPRPPERHTAASVEPALCNEPSRPAAVSVRLKFVQRVAVVKKTTTTKNSGELLLLLFLTEYF